MNVIVAIAVLGGLGWLFWRGRAVAARAGAGRGVIAGGPGLVLAMGLWALTLLPPGAGLLARLFSLHEAGHLVLRLLAPLLLVLAWPFPALLAGLPRRWRRRRAQLPGRAVFAGLPMALAMLIAWFYLWHLPALHRLARSAPLLLLVVHLGMAATGVNFMARVLDRRGDPQAMTQARRLLALIVVILSNILLGSLLTLKQRVLFAGYDGGLADEAIGGYTIWVPSSMVMIVVVLLLFVRWNAAEENHWRGRHLAGGSNSAALEFPETAGELRLKTAGPNRSFARLLGGTALAIFLTVFATVAVIVALG